MPRTLSRPTVLTFCLFAAVLALMPRLAMAHAVLVQSTPQRNGHVTGPDVAIVLQYNSRVDGTRSALSLLAPDGQVKKLVIESQSAPNRLSAKAAGLGKGSYVLRWQAVASDGHITRGEVPFHVD